MNRVGERPALDHCCYCTQCAPERFPAVRGLVAGHVDVRTDVLPGPGRRWQALLDGQDVSDDTSEALPGSSGWVRRYGRDRIGKMHICQTCGGTLCERVDYGAVEVQIVRAVGR